MFDWIVRSSLVQSPFRARRSLPLLVGRRHSLCTPVDVFPTWTNHWSPY